ncbi:hypothetical protein CDD80_2780 [Ophiocordyceps camponoti-rufipedis]|uniref:Uncharacterized protein n=1 Tax=Ophiocordyceps camponoti-rufipedis TaxID=2004952 RepID=A0A2C5Z6R7_9HYPO|nr:hypothetical protein CDD80_2780 [Ophiocordyceps camponoti-rufipedis]
MQMAKIQRHIPIITSPTLHPYHPNQGEPSDTSSSKTTAYNARDEPSRSQTPAQSLAYGAEDVARSSGAGSVCAAVRDVGGEQRRRINILS